MAYSTKTSLKQMILKKLKYYKKLKNKISKYREERMILSFVQKIIHRQGYIVQHAFKILDYGCKGRKHYAIFTRLAEYLYNIRVSLEVTSYDMSLNRLLAYRKYLMSLGFKSQLDILHIPLESRKLILIDVLCKGSLKIQLVHGIVSHRVDDMQLLSQNKFDFIISMVGVIATVAGKVNRLAIKKMLFSLLNEKGVLLIVLPTRNSFKRESAIYQYLRMSQTRIHPIAGSAIANQFNGIIKLARETGDIYYYGSPYQKTAHKFLHLYKIGEVLVDLLTIGLKSNKVFVSHVIHPLRSSSSILMSVIDYILVTILNSKFCPLFIREKYSSSLVVISEK